MIGWINFTNCASGYDMQSPDMQTSMLFIKEGLTLTFKCKDLGCEWFEMFSDTNIVWQDDLRRGLVPRYPSALSLKPCLSNVFCIPSSQLRLLQAPDLGKQYFLNVIQSPCGAICRAFTCHYGSMAVWRAAAVWSWNVGNHFSELWCHSQASICLLFVKWPHRSISI